MAAVAGTGAANTTQRTIPRTHRGIGPPNRGGPPINPPLRPPCGEPGAFEDHISSGPLATAVLVTIEGIDGSGKTTAGHAVADALRAEGVRVKRTEEPTDTWLGKAVRRALREDVDPAALAFLFMADRAEHVKRIETWNQQGYVVLSDRYADSTIAYQAVALADRFPDEDALDVLARWQWRFFPKPDLTLWCDVAPATGLERIEDRARHDHFEKKSFLRKVRANYRRMMDAEPDRWVRVDAGRKPDTVAQSAVEAVLERLPEATK